PELGTGVQLADGSRPEHVVVASIAPVVGMKAHGLGEVRLRVVEPAGAVEMLAEPVFRRGARDVLGRALNAAAGFLRRERVLAAITLRDPVAERIDVDASSSLAGSRGIRRDRERRGI